MTTVLVVDDSEDDREIYSKLLYYNNFDVIVASDAVGAVQAARSRRPDIILMDINLGDISGLAAAEYLRDDPQTRSIPVICFTSMDVPFELARQIGCTEVLQKPVSAVELLAAIRRQIAPAPDRDQKSSASEPPDVPLSTI